MIVSRVNDSGILRRQVRIKRMLVMGTGFAVHTDQKRLVPQWFDVFLVMPGDIFGYLLYAFIALEEILQVHRPFKDLVQFIDVGRTLGFG